MSKKQKMTAVVLSQEKIAEDIYSMWLKAEPIAAEAVPGQFISMYTNDGGKLLPRPISLCEIDQEKGALRVVYRVTGKQTGTEQFSLMKEGDTLDVMGPLGNGFDLETGREKKAMLFGGGIGVPPMLELAKQLKAGYQTECQLVMGYRSETFLTKELEEMEHFILLQKMEAREPKETSWMQWQRTAWSRCDLCLRTDSDAACHQAVCRREQDRVLHFDGRKNGLRSWRMSGMRLSVQRSGSPQSCS